MKLTHLFILAASLILMAGLACSPPSADAKAKLPTRIPDLIKILGESNAPNRQAAIEALGARSLEAIDPLIAAMGNIEKMDDGRETAGSQDRRKGAVEALAKIGVAAVPALGQALNSPQWEVRSGAIEALRKIGPDASTATTQLASLFSTSRDLDERVSIMYALSDIAPTNSDTIGLVQMCLMSKDLRYQALRVLGKIGPPAAQSVTRINGYLTDPDEQTRNEAMMSLRGIGPVEGVVPAVEGRLKDQAARNRVMAADVLGSFGEKAAEATPGLVQSLSDTDATARRAIVKALGSIAPASKDGIDALAKELQDTDPQVRREAANSLGKFGALASKAVPALQKAADTDEFDYVKTAAKQAIEAIGKGA